MGQFQDSMYRDTPAIIRDVTAAQFAAQKNNAPPNNGLLLRVDGAAIYSWNGTEWVTQVSSAVNGVSNAIEIRAGSQLIIIGAGLPSDSDGRPDGTIYIRRS